MRIPRASLTGNVASGLRSMRNVGRRKRGKNGARFIRLVRRAAPILDVDGVTMVQGQGRDSACQVGLVVQAVKAWTHARSNDGTSLNALVSKLLMVTVYRVCTNY